MNCTHGGFPFFFSLCRGKSPVGKPRCVNLLSCRTIPKLCGGHFRNSYHPVTRFNAACLRAHFKWGTRSRYHTSDSSPETLRGQVKKRQEKKIRRRERERDSPMNHQRRAILLHNVRMLRHGSMCWPRTIRTWGCGHCSCCLIWRAIHSHCLLLEVSLFCSERLPGGALAA